MVHSIKGFGQINGAHVDRRAIIYVMLNNILNGVNYMGTAHMLLKIKLVITVARQDLKRSIMADSNNLEITGLMDIPRKSLTVSERLRTSLWIGTV
jgi:hypothetical protein